MSFGQGETRTASCLLRDAARVSGALEGADRDRTALLIFRRDRYAFSAALLGALGAGFRVTLPADTGRETVLALAQRSSTGPVLHDTLSGAPIRVDALLDAPSGATLDAFEVPPDSARIELVVSPADEGLRSVELTLGQLCAEALALVDSLSLGPQSLIFSGLPASQRSGLVLGILCPLLCGAAFAREPVCDVSALAEALDATRAGVWVTVPAQLSDALTRERRSLSGLVAVVSAAVPAEDSLRAACAEHLGLPIQQVLDHPPSGGRTRERGLSDVEAKLRACAGVRDAALVVPERGPYAGRVLAWVDAQPFVTEASLRETLREVRVGPLEPARILIRDRVPRDALGEVRRAALLRGFTLRADGEPLRMDVDFGEHEARLIDGRAEHVFHLHVPEDYAYFDGHFPGYPILPGAAQLGELVMPCVRRVRPALGQLSAMSQLKFLGRILPGDEVQVVLAFREAEATVDFTLRCRNAVAATGRLTFTAQATLGGDDD